MATSVAVPPPAKPKAARRGKLTLAQRLVPLDRIIKAREEQLRKAYAKRNRIIEEESAKVRAALAEVEKVSPKAVAVTE